MAPFIWFIVGVFAVVIGFLISVGVYFLLSTHHRMREHNKSLYTSAFSSNDFKQFKNIIERDVSDKVKKELLIEIKKELKEKELTSVPVTTLDSTKKIKLTPSTDILQTVSIDSPKENEPKEDTKNVMAKTKTNETDYYEEDRDNVVEIDVAKEANLVKPRESEDLEVENSSMSQYEIDTLLSSRSNVSTPELSKFLGKNPDELAKTIQHSMEQGIAETALMLQMLQGIPRSRTELNKDVMSENRLKRIEEVRTNFL